MHPRPAIGVDRGVAVAVATSAGDLLDQVFATPAEQRRAVRLQRKLSRAAKGSANRNKTRDALGNSTGSRAPPAPRLLRQDRTPVGAQQRSGRAGEAARRQHDPPC